MGTLNDAIAFRNSLLVQNNQSPKQNRNTGTRSSRRASSEPAVPVIVGSSARLPCIILAINVDATASRGVCVGSGEMTLGTCPLSCEPMEDEEADPRKRQRCGPMDFHQGPTAGQWAWPSATVGSGWAAGRLLAPGGGGGGGGAVPAGLGVFRKS